LKSNAKAYEKVSIVLFDNLRMIILMKIPSKIVFK